MSRMWSRLFDGFKLRSLELREIRWEDFDVQLRRSTSKEAMDQTLWVRTIIRVSNFRLGTCFHMQAPLAAYSTFREC